MSDITQNNKRLAKNTMVLYMRTIFVLVISLYTSRKTLEILGIDDYGIYNVVGGFVGLFAIISQTLVASSQRFLTFELGKGKNGHSMEVFSTALTIHIVLAIVLLLVFETFGLWFLNNNLNISQDRMFATNIIYQFSIITFIVSIIRSPFEASIIAHEKMALFAYLNIFEAILKLSILFLISICSTIDSLVQYGFYLMMISILGFCISSFYCRRKFEEISFVFIRELAYYKSMFSFAGYNFLGSVSSIFANQGLNILLNIYFGVAVNAARGVANQVYSAVSKFVNDFTLALNPQITKSYAQGDIDYTMSLVYKGSKFSFYLFLLLGLPICLEIHYLLRLWLNIVPRFTEIFVIWTIATATLNTFALSLSTCAMATGDIKKLSIWLGTLRLLVLPVAYICFELGLSAEYAYSITFVSTAILVFVRLFIVCNQLNVSAMIFAKKVILRCLFVGSLSIFSGLLINLLFEQISFFKLIFEFILITISTLTFIVFLGISNSERNMMFSFIKRKIWK